MIIRHILLTIAAIASFLNVKAAEPVVEAFKTAPASAFPLLDKNARLDMVDYYTSGLSTPSKNGLGGLSRIDSLTDEFMHINMTVASDVELARLTGGKTDLILLISTIATPSPDSKLSVFTSDWSKDLTSKVFTPPSLTDWLTPDGRRRVKEIRKAVPFMIVGYHYDPTTKTLLLTTEIKSVVGNDVYKEIAAAFTDSIAYVWNGSKFQRRK